MVLCVRDQSVPPAVTPNMASVRNQESANVKLVITARIVTSVTSCWAVVEMDIVRRLLNVNVIPDGQDYFALSQCVEKVVT